MFCNIYDDASCIYLIFFAHIFIVLFASVVNLLFFIVVFVTRSVDKTIFVLPSFEQPRPVI